jgi:sugar O-acyltransferase (sialic acid O-acetyltransferase NeuD family)
MTALIIWGGTGQAIVLEEILSESYSIVAIIDNNPKLINPFPRLPLLKGGASFTKWKATVRPAEISYIVAIGGANGKIRHDIHLKLKNESFIPVTAVHKSAVIAKDVNISDGCQILANSTINPRVELGEATIINTAASIDHECILGKGVGIAPGAHLAGLVTVGDYSFVGTGATILPRIKIGKNSIVGAGAVVTKDVPDNVVVYGIPARIIRNQSKHGG